MGIFTKARSGTKAIDRILISTGDHTGSPVHFPKYLKLNIMHVDVKVSVWKRIELPEGVSKEKIIKMLESGESGIDDLFDVYENLDYNEVENSEETLIPEDNSNQETIELYCPDEKGDGPIWTNKPAEVIVEPTCVLFGNDAVNILGNDGIKGLVKAIKKDNNYMAYEIQEFTQSASIADVLSAADGWGSYAFLTKKEYKKLESL